MTSAFGLAIVTPPAIEPVTLAEARLQLGLDADQAQLDAVIVPAIATARQTVEQFLDASLMPTRWRLSLPAWPGAREPLRLPKPPLATVHSVAYTTAAGEAATWASTEWRALPDYSPGRLVPAFGKCWPGVVCNEPDAVRIEYTAGFADQASVPQKLRQAILLLAVEHVEQRMPTGEYLPDVVRRLIEGAL